MSAEEAEEQVIRIKSGRELPGFQRRLSELYEIDYLFCDVSPYFRFADKSYPSTPNDKACRSTDAHREHGNRTAIYTFDGETHTLGSGARARDIQQW